MTNGLLLLRRRDVMRLGHLSEWKYRTLVENGVLRPLEQRGTRQHLFAVSEVEKVVEYGDRVSHG